MADHAFTGKAISYLRFSSPRQELGDTKSQPGGKNPGQCSRPYPHTAHGSIVRRAGAAWIAPGGEL